MNKTAINELPQLIIALDSLKNDANYVHINHAKPNLDYYCPCCHGIIRPRAFKDDKDYKVQAHFYHISGGCTEESYIHFICKNWLFDSESKFQVNEVLYHVESIDIEKPFNTKYGIYKPDIYVKTREKKVFFFEISNTNKKNHSYIPKWDELGIDVVEINIREFINKKYDNDVPVLDIIYSDGICYVSEKIPKDYNALIQARKQEWKRQDILNYKIQWERLDWFWQKFSKYKANKENDEYVLSSFEELEYTDKIWIYRNINKKSCSGLVECFRNIINKEFFDMITQLNTEEQNVCVSCERISQLIYEVGIICYIKYKDYNLHDGSTYKMKFDRGKIFELYNINNIKEIIQKQSKHFDDVIKEIDKLSEYETIGYIHEIKPYSHYGSESKNVDSLDFKVVFCASIPADTVPKIIGSSHMLLKDINESSLETEFQSLYGKRLKEYNDESYLSKIKKNVLYSNMLKDIIKYAQKYNFTVDISDDMLFYSIRSKKSRIFDFETKIGTNINNDYIEKQKTDVKRCVKAYVTSISLIEKYVGLINQCKNKMWNAKYKTVHWVTEHYRYKTYTYYNSYLSPHNVLYITLKNRNCEYNITKEIEFDIFDSEDYIKQKITKAMNIMINGDC